MTSAYQRCWWPANRRVESIAQALTDHAVEPDVVLAIEATA
jgi:hypothetical protein